MFASSLQRLMNLALALVIHGLLFMDSGGILCPAAKFKLPSFRVF